MACLPAQESGSIPGAGRADEADYGLLFGGFGFGNGFGFGTWSVGPNGGFPALGGVLVFLAFIPISPDSTKLHLARSIADFPTDNHSGSTAVSALL